LIIGGLVLVLLLIAFLFLFNKNFKKPKVVVELKTPNIMRIKSPAFENNSYIPPKYTCDGGNINPPLEISDIPKGTQGLLLIVDDPDAPGNTFLHWLVFNINPNTSLIEENSIPSQAIEGKNDFGRQGYGGPCPPSGTHRYFFKVYALDKKLDLPSGAELNQVLGEIENHILDQAQLIGLYKRQ